MSEIPNKNNSAQRSRALIVLALVFLLAGIGYGVYWWLHSRNFETTDDASVAGNLMHVCAISCEGSTTYSLRSAAHSPRRIPVRINNLTIVPKCPPICSAAIQTAFSSSSVRTREREAIV